MNRRSMVPRTVRGLVLAMAGLLTNLIAPVVGLEPAHAEVAQATAATWVPTGSLNTARSNHTATLLKNGKVLIVGGYGGSILDSAELYDPATGKWTVTGRMSSPRVGHTATMLSDGKVLVAGGDTSSSPPNFGRSITAEMYDPVTGTWTPTASMITIRSGHTATLLQDGKVLVAGGFNLDTLGSAELYDPATGTWRMTGSLSRRYWHTATLLLDGRVLVVGGSDDGDLASTLSTAAVYDPVAGTWSAARQLVVPVVSHTATLLRSGRVMVAGGYMPHFLPSAAPISLNTVQLYDPVTDTWNNTQLNASRDSHTATLLPNGDVLVAGGEAWSGQYPAQFETLNSAELYDSNSGRWASTSSLTARSRHTATLLVDGRVLVAGGDLGSAELYGEANVPLGAIGPGITGSWYDPAQSGHGLFIEVLPGNRFYTAWFAFTPSGSSQAWFDGVGTYSGNTATITAVEQPTGGRWIPNFDPSQVVRNPWGTLTFTFSDCDHGRVDFNSIAGYGNGTMNLTRLTQPAGLSCP